ncbi:MAG: hypothetical protein HQ547_04245 [Candidatus Omnitrophica bacterium]|nr:hypothetical protein [Candidatus Omnitrophota bacterium]
MGNEEGFFSPFLQKGKLQVQFACPPIFVAGETNPNIYNTPMIKIEQVNLVLGFKKSLN